MHGQIVEDPAVAGRVEHPGRPGRRPQAVWPGRLDRHDVTELAPSDDLEAGLGFRVPALLQQQSQRSRARAGRGPDGIEVGQGRAHRLVRDHVTARGESVDDDRGPVAVHGSHREHVRSEAEQCPVVGVPGDSERGRALGPHRVVGVGDPDEVHRGTTRLGEHGLHVRVPEPGHRHSQPAHPTEYVRGLVMHSTGASAAGSPARVCRQTLRRSPGRARGTAPCGQRCLIASQPRPTCGRRHGPPDGGQSAGMASDPAGPDTAHPLRARDGTVGAHAHGGTGRRGKTGRWAGIAPAGKGRDARPRTRRRRRRVAHRGFATALAASAGVRSAVRRGHTRLRPARRPAPALDPAAGARRCHAAQTGEAAALRVAFASPLAMLLLRPGSTTAGDSDVAWWQAFGHACAIVGRRPATALAVTPSGVGEIALERQVWPDAG